MLVVESHYALLCFKVNSGGSVFSLDNKKKKSEVHINLIEKK